MGTPDFGPNWFWRIMLISAICGVFGIAYGLFRIATWVFQHVSID